LSAVYWKGDSEGVVRDIFGGVVGLGGFGEWE